MAGFILQRLMDVTLRPTKLWLMVVLLLIVSLTAGCGLGGVLGGVVPLGISGVYNVAVISSGPVDNRGWSQSHYQGVAYLQASLPDVNVIHLNGVQELNASRSLIGDLARKGYQLIIATDFGYAEDVEAIAAQYPDVLFVQVLGQKTNGNNLLSLNGAIEEMEYLAGILAGARAQLDGNPRLGFIATFPLPEQFRLINAAARGMRVACPVCTLEVRWLHSWYDAEREAGMADELFNAGVQVVFSGTISPFLKAVAEKNDRWFVPLGLAENCDSPKCLTAGYWKWGPIYQRIIQLDRSNELANLELYFHTDWNGLGLFGLMTGEQLTPGMQGLPPEMITAVRTLLERMIAGENEALQMVFAGPIINQHGDTILPAGEHLTWKDLDQFPPGAPDNRCSVCMYWFAEGVNTELPEILEIRP